MTLEQHIEELRAELRGISDPGEIEQIETELQIAQAKLDAAFRAWLERPD